MSGFLSKNKQNNNFIKEVRPKFFLSIKDLTGSLTTVSVCLFSKSNKFLDLFLDLFELMVFK